MNRQQAKRFSYSYVYIMAGEGDSIRHHGVERWKQRVSTIQAILRMAD